MNLPESCLWATHWTVPPQLLDSSSEPQVIRPLKILAERVVWLNYNQISDHVETLPEDNPVRKGMRDYDTANENAYWKRLCDDDGWTYPRPTGPFTPRSLTSQCCSVILTNYQLIEAWTTAFYGPLSHAVRCLTCVDKQRRLEMEAHTGHVFCYLCEKITCINLKPCLAAMGNKLYKFPALYRLQALISLLESQPAFTPVHQRILAHLKQHLTNLQFSILTGAH